MQSKSKLRIAILLFFIYFGIVANGISIEHNYTLQVKAEEFKPGDIASWFDVEALNVTYAISPGTAQSSAQLSSLSVSSSKVFHIERVHVRSSSVPYKILEDSIDDNDIVMHNGNQEFLRTYYTIAKLTGEYRLSKIVELMSYRNDLSQLRLKLSSQTSNVDIAKVQKVQSLLGLLAATNDTTEASGFIATGEAKIALEDFRGENNVVVNTTGPYVAYQSDKYETRYQKWAIALSGNTSETDLVKASALDDEKNYQFSISGFVDTEEDGFFTTLRANLAANHSTPADPVTPDRITILDYTLWNANLTNYLSKDFQQRIRKALDDYEEKVTVSTQSTINVFGLFKVNSPVYSIPASAAPAGLFDFVGDAVNGVVNTAKAVIDTAANAPKIIKNTVTNIGDTIKSRVNTVIENGKTLANAAVKVSKALVKGTQNFVGSVANTLVNTGKSVLDAGGKVVGGVIKEGQKLINGPIEFVSGIGKGFTETITKLLILAGAGIGIFLVALVAYKLISRPRGPGGLRPY